MDNRRRGTTLRVALRWLERLLDGLVVAGMIIISALVFWQFFSRYVLNFSLTWSEEVATFIMIWAGLLGLVSHLRHGSFIGFDVLGRSGNRPVRLAANLVAQGATAVFMLIVVWLGLEMSVFSESTGISSAAEIPLRWIYAIYPVMALGVLIRLIARSWRVWREQLA